MDNHLLRDINKIHFVGIGGSGMCPMAILLHDMGYRVTGSDMNESETLAQVRGCGIQVDIGHRAENIRDAQAIVFTAAAKDDNPEILEANDRSIPAFTRAQVLGAITDMFPFTIGVSGTHGKTTTTSMITQIMVEDKKDPSAIIGGRLPIINGNSKLGASDILVCEACEYVDTFLSLHPKISVITNIEADHLDYFGSLKNIIQSFYQFASQTSDYVVVCGDDPCAMESVTGITNARIVTFGINPENDFYAADTLEADTVCEKFTLMHGNKKLGQIHLNVPGEHNMLNALAAAAASYLAGATAEGICRGLQSFGGVHRRFEILGIFDGITIADDFAHHPTELTAVLSSAMKMGYSKVWAVFQPHTYSRTYNFFDEFVEALSIPDQLVMTEILAVREDNKYNIHTSDLAEKVPGSLWFDSIEKIVTYIMKNAKSGDLILTLGGGDIYKCANLFVSKYGETGDKKC